MTVKDQLVNDLLKYPKIIKNKWSCYHQWFSVVGNGMVWEDGELIDGFSIGKKPLKNINDTIDSLFYTTFQDFEDKVRDYTIDIFDCGTNDMVALDAMNEHIEYINEKLVALKQHIKMDLTIKDRINDFTQSDEFSPLTTESILCNLPETDITDDWKIACQEFYDWIKEHFDEMTEETKTNFKKIKTSWLNI